MLRLPRLARLAPYQDLIREILESSKGWEDQSQQYLMKRAACIPRFFLTMSSGASLSKISNFEWRRPFALLSTAGEEASLYSLCHCCRHPSRRVGQQGCTHDICAVAVLSQTDCSSKSEVRCRPVSSDLFVGTQFGEMSGGPS